MKWLKIGAAFVIIAAVAVVVIFPRINNFQREGRIVLSGLKAPVKVHRDENGMAYIYAENEDDLLKAQGFATVQDRLFQMQVIRLLATGRICELVGEKGERRISQREPMASTAMPTGMKKSRMRRPERSFNFISSESMLLSKIVQQFLPGSKWPQSDHSPSLHRKSFGTEIAHFSLRALNH